MTGSWWFDCIYNKMYHHVNYKKIIIGLKRFILWWADCFGYGLWSFRIVSITPKWFELFLKSSIFNMIELTIKVRLLKFRRKFLIFSLSRIAKSLEVRRIYYSTWQIRYLIMVDIDSKMSEFWYQNNKHQKVN